MQVTPAGEFIVDILINGVQLLDYNELEVLSAAEQESF